MKNVSILQCCGAIQGVAVTRLRRPIDGAVEGFNFYQLSIVWRIYIIVDGILQTNLFDVIQFQQIRNELFIPKKITYSYTRYVFDQT